MKEKKLKLHELLTSNLNEINDVTLKEIENRIMEAINFDNRKIRDLTITEVKIKFKKNRSKYFKEINQGDIFEIYLRDISKYVYGIVVSGEINKNKDEEILIGYLNKFSPTELLIDEIFQLVKQRKFLFIANTGISGIREHRWRFVTNYSDKVFSDEELRKIPYKVYFLDKYRKSVGDSVKEIAECEVISKEEADQIPNPLGIAGEKAIENLLIQKFQDTI
ncbi:hypothetical protein PNH38_08265 [Anoxybacillus rupiensis]|uniref:Uncharacterized protein n=1 Tax=Anoxybacteroides rupiense TaxID=311460 RepID=A0ABT5W3T4_9BACL|nr:Imm26 family immunity protein [Anoxybacillus rupiensis]MDE8563877.1 hypothetical protein [Anoxybacillus rupiensis]